MTGVSEKRKAREKPKAKKPTKKAAPIARRTRERVTAKVEKILDRIEAGLTKADLKPTVGDYLKLLQFKEEIEHDEPREIKVTWVDPETKESEKLT